MSGTRTIVHKLMRPSKKSLETTAVRGQKIEEHAVTDLVLGNNESKPSLTSGAAPVAEECQVK